MNIFRSDYDLEAVLFFFMMKYTVAATAIETVKTMNIFVALDLKKLASFLFSSLIKFVLANAPVLSSRTPVLSARTISPSIYFSRGRAELESCDVRLKNMVKRYANRIMQPMMQRVRIGILKLDTLPQFITF